MADWAPLQRAKSKLPPPPFLVSAVIESLFGSEYADRMWVVDGEADAFCAAAAFEAARHQDAAVGITIFTNDSDLVRIASYPSSLLHLSSNDASTQCS